MNYQDLEVALKFIKDNLSRIKKESAWENIEKIDPEDDDFLLIEKLKSKAEADCVASLMGILK